ncbi:MAG: hypothetical protein IJA00_08910 [Bacteroidaceae bacterium]|nr:hypothetical protein [Bacteroidaceae bacterium]
MMKKIFSKYFVVAVVAVAMGCISSCKDFDDEMYMSLRGEDVGLQKNLADSIAQLRKEMKDGLKVARQERDALREALNERIDSVKDNYATKTELNNAIAGLRNDLTNADAALKTELLQKIKADSIRIEALEDSITVHLNKITTAMTTIGQLDNRIVQDSIRLNNIETTYAKLTDVETKLADYLTKVDAEKYTDADELKAEHDSIIKEVKVMLSNINADGDLYATVTRIIDAKIKEIFDGLGNPGEGLEELVKKAQAAADSAKSHAAALENLRTEIENLATDSKELMDALKERVAVLESRVDTLSGIEETKALANAAEEKAKAFAKEYTDVACDAILDYVNPRFTSIEELLAELFVEKEAHKDWLLAHDDSIAALRADITDIESRVKKNEEAIAGLTEKTTDVIDAIVNRISSVVLQATKSPVVGYFNIPMGIKSNVLAAYYGEAMNDVYFPTIRTANLISGDAFTEEEAKLLGFTDKVLFEQGGVLIDTVQGNAGTLYMTVNPAEVNLDSVKFALVNSVEDTSYVVLSKPVASSEKLTFGYTRAANGFYEAKATVSAKDAAAAKMRVDLNDVKSLASELKSSVENLNVNFTGIATSIQSIVNDVADATAVRASWSDSMGIHNVYSEYALAAMTVKPLSFQFMQNFEMKNFPGITRVSNFINNAIDKINIEISIDKIDKIEISDIDVPSFEELDVNTVVNTFVTIEGTEYPIEVPVKDVVEELYNGMTEPFDNVNEMLADLEKQVNDMLEQLNAVNDIEQSITDAKNDIKKELNGYLERLNNKLCGAINSVHDRLQPNMLLKTEDGFAMLSQVKNMPTELDAANCVLVPTTYTGELLVPAFKKYVAVVNVKDAEGNDVTSAEIANVNTGKLNTVLAGSTTEIEFAGKSGYTYELVYSALDYSGKYSNVRYYVTVK